MNTIAVVFGTRPEAIKMAPVVAALRETPGVRLIVIATAQHREMLDQVLDIFGIVPDADLNLMKPGQTLDEITARVLTETGKALDALKPDLVLVQGDTTTVFAAALAAFYRKIPVGHVEAGLRANHRYEPFPEEINRRLAGTLASLHFAPTKWAADNLLREGVDKAAVHVTGNPVVDSLNFIMQGTASPEFGFLDPSKKLVVMTAHRRESFGEPIREIFRAVARVASERPDVQFVYAVHPNPNVRQAVSEILEPVSEWWLESMNNGCGSGRETATGSGKQEIRKGEFESGKQEIRKGESESGKQEIRKGEFGSGKQEIRKTGRMIADHVSFAPQASSVIPQASGLRPQASNIVLLNPLDYVSMIHLMKRARLLLTDSGGIQEEGTALGRPVLVLRERTERPEAVEAGCARLVGTDSRIIAASLHELLDDSPAYAAMSKPSAVFGDGSAGRRIARICAEFLTD